MSASSRATTFTDRSASTGRGVFAGTTAFTGTATLARLALRRDRVLAPVWIGVFVLLAGTSASATSGLYPTVQDRVQAAASFNGTASLAALYGRVYDPTSLGAIAMVKMSGFGTALVAVLAVILVIRHTRAEEEAGRLELLGSTVVGRWASLTAALAVTGTVCLVLGLFTAAALTAGGLPPAGSIAFGLGWAATGLAFAGIASVAAQLSRGARAATGLTLSVLAAGYLLRAIGDSADPDGPTWASWLSPIGWDQHVRAFAHERWWVLGLLLVLALATGGGGFALAARRDHGAGLLPDRPGRAVGSRWLAGPTGLAWRLQRATLAGWAAAFVLLGLVLGNIAGNVGTLLTSQQARDFVLRLGGQKGLTDAFLATEMGFAGIIAAAYGVQAAARLFTEEDSGRAEPLLATATGRGRWVLGHLLVALAGPAVLLCATGLSAGLARWVHEDDAGQLGRVLAGALVQLPAVWVLVGITFAAFGLVPRAAVAGWVALVVFLLLAELGPLLHLDRRLMDLSPFAHIPKLPGSPFTVGPVLGVSGVALVLLAAGWWGVRRRDVH